MIDFGIGGFGGEQRSQIATRFFRLALANEIERPAQCVFGNGNRRRRLLLPESHQRGDKEDDDSKQEWIGGRHGVRTHDPHVANVVLSQLS